MIRLNFSKDYRYKGMTLDRLDGIIADAEALGFDTSLTCHESGTFLIDIHQMKFIFSFLSACFVSHTTST